MKQYVIDLDQPPTQRWVEPCKDHVEHMKVLEQDIIKVGAEFGWLCNFARFFAIPNDLLQEMQGIAMMCHVDFDTILKFNVGYDLLTACTAAASLDPCSHNMKHFRTLDWDLPILKQLTIIAKFYRSGRHLYSAVTQVGAVGVITGLSSMGHSISLNFRKPDVAIWRRAAYKITALVWRQLPCSLLIRKQLDLNLETTDFISTMQTAVMASPCYLVIVDKARATLITYGPGVNEKMQRWHAEPFTQTNHDRDHAYRSFLRWAGSDELLRNSRCRARQMTSVLTSARECTKSVTPDEWLVHPVINNQTVFAVVMCPETGSLSAVLDPCCVQR